MSTKIETIIEGTLPIMLAPLDQIGLCRGLGLQGFPSNRIIVVYGEPGGGKSSFSFYTMGQYLRNDDEVRLYETEHALDRIYMASYLPELPDPRERALQGLEYFKKNTLRLLKANEKAIKDKKPPLFNKRNQEIMEARLEILPIIIQDIKEGRGPRESEIDTSMFRTIVRQAIAEDKLKDIDIIHPGSLEDFEKDAIDYINKKQQNPKRAHKRSLIVTDSLSYLLPKEDIEKAVSSDGRNFSLAKYLHTLFPRLVGLISGKEISLIFIMQQTTHIKMNIFERTTAISRVQGKGGTATKFGATFMIGIEPRTGTNNARGENIKVGALSIPKAKYRGGGSGPSDEALFYLKEKADGSHIDFDEPFIASVFNKGEMETVSYRNAYYLPEKYFVDEPNFESELKEALAPLPEKAKAGKKSSENELLEFEEEEEETAPEATNEKTTQKEEPLYMKMGFVEAIDFLKTNKLFRKNVIDECDLTGSY